MPGKPCYSVELRGYATRSAFLADTGGVSAFISATRIHPSRVPVGPVRKRVGDITIAPKKRVCHIDIAARPVATRARTLASADQDYGDYEHIDDVLCMPYVSLHRVHLIGSNPSAGPVPRPAKHDSDTPGSGSIWGLTTDDPPGILPMLVECPDGIDLQPGSGGYDTMKLTLIEREPTTPA